nr:hypothetical protein CTI12_AA159120 [Tanacetum cinerariifolium]
MRQYVKNQSSAIYNTGWTMAYVKSFTNEQLKQEFENIRKVQSHSQIQAFSRTLKRPGPVLEEPSSKRPKSPKAPTSFMPEVPISLVVSSPPSSRTRRKSLGRKHILKSKSTLPNLDLEAESQSFINVAVSEDSDDEVTPAWSAVVGWEVLPTPFGGKGFVCLETSKSVGNKKLEAIHSFKFPTGKYVVPTGRVIVLTGRYVVPTSRVIVTTGMYVVPPGYSQSLTGNKDLSRVGSNIDHYAKLWDYRDEILSTNHGLTVQLDVDTLDDGKTQFERMYICFKEGCISCRRVIGLDGCFLKSTCRGELLTAMGRDSNNQMFPMAWAVVSIENSENWLWFLSNLGSDFNLAMGAYLTIISNGHKGLVEAVNELLPHAEHRLCARHIYANFKNKWNGLHYKSLFWDAAASTLEKGARDVEKNTKDPGKGVSSWYSKQMWVDVCSNFIKPVSGSSIWVKSANPPPLPPKKRIMSGRPGKNRIKHVTHGVNQLSRASRCMTCSNCWEKDPSSADLSASDPSSTDPSAADPISVDPSAADPSSADTNQTFTGLLNCAEQQSMGAEITDAEIVALVDMMK